MSNLSEEIDENALAFSKEWISDLNKNAEALKNNNNIKESYRRITALQALKVGIIQENYSKSAIDFFAEAQNDALTSHVLASFGAWRPALQSLRSCIENVLNAHYYNDHPIELRMWSNYEFRMGFSSLHTYFCKHPDVSPVGTDISGLNLLKEEYGTLSKAVHASAPIFRMTDPAAKLLLWNNDASKLGMWATRERKVIEGVCLLTTILNQPQLSGTAQTNVRVSVMVKRGNWSTSGLF